MRRNPPESTAIFDSRLRPLIDPPLNRAGAWLAGAGVTANAVTWAGFALGTAAALAIATGNYGWGLILLLASRLGDGLDGAVARASVKTDLGGYLDIVLDFIFYGAIPLGFAVADPAGNALAAAVLLATFYASGSSFLAFAIMAERRGLETAAQGQKSLYYLGGLTEGFETILALSLFCLFPDHFPVLALIFAALVAISTGARILQVIRALS